MITAVSYGLPDGSFLYIPLFKLLVLVMILYSCFSRPTHPRRTRIYAVARPNDKLQCLENLSGSKHDEDAIVKYRYKRCRLEV